MSKEDRKEARREAFVTAGIAVIGESGIADTKVRDVCKQAELTERYFYESFDNLDAFAKAVVETVAMQVAGRLFVKAVGIEDGQARLRAVAKELVTIVDEDPRVGRILFVETERRRRGAGQAAAADAVRDHLADDHVAGQPRDQYGRSGPADDGAIPHRRIRSRGAGDGRYQHDSDHGASAEMIMAWVDHRLDITAEELVDCLVVYIDETIAWQRRLGAEQPT